MLSALSGNFRKMVLFTSLIFVHELGHFLTAYFFHWKVDKIVLYPYGGCSYFEVDINTSNKEEFFVLMMGPIFQIVFTYSLSFLLRESDFSFLFLISKLLLIFNFLPIYPLDGGKLLLLIMSSFFSYYQSLKITFYSSFLFYFLLLFVAFIFYQSLFWLLLLFTLFFRLWKEQKNGNYLYQKFLLERYLNTYHFSKDRIVSSIFSMRKGYYHLFLENGKCMREEEYLKKYFLLS